MALGLAFPITLILLVLVFGSLIAAGLPLLVGVVSIAGSFLALFAISSVTESTSDGLTATMTKSALFTASATLVTSTGYVSDR